MLSSCSIYFIKQSLAEVSKQGCRLIKGEDSCCILGDHYLWNCRKTAICRIKYVYIKGYFPPISIFFKMINVFSLVFVLSLSFGGGKLPNDVISKWWATFARLRRALIIGGMTKIFILKFLCTVLQDVCSSVRSRAIPLLDNEFSRRVSFSLLGHLGILGKKHRALCQGKWQVTNFGLVRSAYYQLTSKAPFHLY